jgi:8-oxo-dGTP pyrophosphatase MutT (NUDIX family)
MNKTRDALITLLRQIPTHREPPKPIERLIEQVAQAEGLTQEEARGAVSTGLSLLDAFGALDEKTLYRARNQLSAYFIRSLGWFVEHQLRASLITSKLLGEMESRRVQLGREKYIHAAPSREQDAVFVLIVRHNEFGEPEILFRFDERASRYQLIGGRIEPGETPEHAALREFVEEIGESQSPLIAHEDIRLRKIIDAPIEWIEISPSYGALTQYHFFAYHARLALSELQLGENDRWVGVEQMLSGDPLLGDARIYAQLDHRIEGGLAGLPVSTRILM